MRKLEKLKLNQVSKKFLTEQEMNILLGRGTPGNCNCGCGYANNGGSSTAANDSANNANGYTDSYGYNNANGSGPECGWWEVNCTGSNPFSC
jgi:natural product precursor